MSVASQDVYLNLTTPLDVIGTGGGVGGVNNVLAGQNMSTIGQTTGNVTVALAPNVTNLSSLSFVGGVNISGVSSISGVAQINGSAYPPTFGSLPANISAATLLVSTVQVVVTTGDGNGNSEIHSGRGEGGGGLLQIDLNQNGGQEYIKMDTGAGNPPSVEIGVLTTVDEEGSYAYYSRNEIQNVAVSTIITRATSTIMLDAASVVLPNTATLTVKNITNLANVNGSPYVPSSANPNFSTLGLSTIGPISNANSGASPVQTLNMVIGNMRIQAGELPASSGGTVINWASAFTTVPVVQATVAGVPGSTSIVVVSAAGENEGTFACTNAAPGKSIYWLAIGAA